MFNLADLRVVDVGDAELIEGVDYEGGARPGMRESFFLSVPLRRPPWHPNNEDLHCCRPLMFAMNKLLMNGWEINRGSLYDMVILYGRVGAYRVILGEGLMYGGHIESMNVLAFVRGSDVLQRDGWFGR